MRGIARETKSQITQMALPSTDEIKKLSSDKIEASMREALKTAPHDLYTVLTDQLNESGYSYRDIAAAALQLHFSGDVSAASIPVMAERREQDFHSRPLRGGADRSAYTHKQTRRPRA
jgi:hypothetical protein